jgi:flagellar biosynthesis GTPase FlhF
MTALARRSLYAAVIGDVLDLVRDQPHQVLISTASVAIVASEAAYLVPYPANILMAVGAEWAYLRGIASSPKGSRGWVAALNWGALALVVIFGMLWGARKFGGIPEELGGVLAWLLTAAHILPMAFLSLAAAMVHRSAVETEASERVQAEAEAHARQRRLEAEEDERQREWRRRRDEIEAQRLAKLADVEAMEAASLARQRLRASAQPAQQAAQDEPHSPHAAAPSPMRQIGRDELCALVRAAWEADPQFSRAEMARQTGWSEAMVRKVLKEIQSTKEEENK